MAKSHWADAACIGVSTPDQLTVSVNPDDVETALLAYENDLFPRSASAAAESERNLKLFFDDNAPQSVLDLFTSFRPVE